MDTAEGPMGLVRIDEPTPSVRALRRLAYGPTRSALAQIEQGGTQRWIAEQLDPAGLDTSALDAELARMPALTMSAVEIREEYGRQVPAAGAQLRWASIVRQTNSPAQLYERMVEFWSDHFNVPMDSQVLNLAKIVEDRDVIRPHALGRFSDLLVASAQSPAMLIYLDNFRSTVRGINENYSRELLELHTAGVDAGWTEDDVTALAGLLTGWGVDRDQLTFRFRPRLHDTSAFVIWGWRRPPVGAGTDPQDHGVEFLRHLAMRPETARHVCTKLAVRFVGDLPDIDVIDAMVDAWAANGSSIVPVLEAMVDHPAFWTSPLKFNRPLDQFVTTMRRLETTVSGDLNRRKIGGLRRLLATLGQTPFGWPAPNGYPDVEPAWLNSGGMLARWNVTGDLLSGELPGIATDLRGLRVGLDGLTAAEIVAEVTSRTLHGPVTASGSETLLAILDVDADAQPTPTQIDRAMPTLVHALLTAPEANHR